ncbi:hypothetical protein LCGC14_2103670 [marine sediment metagenome]|uniref:Uncharacterized protein n=1 Tax=marine sediment metagenome TaxID=412755 RepID=A0A0F9E947_9ZZZZ
MKILNLQQIKALSEDDFDDLLKGTINDLNVNGDTYYLDELNNGTYLISRDEFPVEVCLNESVAVKRFEEITS